MSTAPSKAEQYALYAEMFTFSAASIVLFFVGVVFNWRVAKTNLGEVLKPSKGPQNPVTRATEAAIRQLSVWQGPFRRVRRTMTIMLAVALLGIAFADSTIITVSGTELRNDGVAAQWQRWVAYVFYTILSTAAMAQYYGLNEVVTWIFAILPAGFGMAMGVFVTLTSGADSGSDDKIVNFSVWGSVLLVALIPLTLLYTRFSILRALWRSFPIFFHVGFALSLWAILWTGPEVSGKNTKARRVAAAWLYFAMAGLWTAFNVLFFYTWKMGPPKPVTHSTDAVMKNPASRRGIASSTSSSSSPHRVVNLARGSTFFDDGGMPKDPRGLSQIPQYSRGSYPSSTTVAATTPLIGQSAQHNSLVPLSHYSKQQQQQQQQYPKSRSVW